METIIERWRQKFYALRMLPNLLIFLSSCVEMLIILTLRIPRKVVNATMTKVR